VAAAHKVKITVVRKMDMRRLWGDEDAGVVADFPPVCDAFQVGDEFIVAPGQMPAGFCSGAFADIYRYVSGLQRGADYSWMAQPGEVKVCCTDAFRPVVFKIERLDE
jgi:uncharacterized repeat protein (TIGR04076 family)